MQKAQANFTKLNIGWNAEPNAPNPSIILESSDVVLKFYLNNFLYPNFEEGDHGILRFVDCDRYRIGATNDEGWYRGQCRFSGMAPEWGHFYQVTGNPELLCQPEDWIIFQQSKSVEKKHFLFYFRDSTFECRAKACVIEASAQNALSSSDLSV